MAENPERGRHFHSRMAKGFVDMRGESPPDRAYLPMHNTVDEGKTVTVHPACGFTMSHLIDQATGEWKPIMRMDALFYPTSLSFIPTIDELRVIASSATEIADQMEAEAASALDKVLKR